jgi:hypothetical protein
VGTGGTIRGDGFSAGSSRGKPGSRTFNEANVFRSDRVVRQFPTAMVLCGLAQKSSTTGGMNNRIIVASSVLFHPAGAHLDRCAQAGINQTRAAELFQCSAAAIMASNFRAAIDIQLRRRFMQRVQCLALTVQPSVKQTLCQCSRAKNTASAANLMEKSWPR